MTKGCYGYLTRQKKKEIIKTVLFFALSLSVFAIGYATTGTKKNLLTIVAMLGFLPASKSMGSMIMYLKAGVCSQVCYERLQKIDHGGMHMLYDLYLTSYRSNFQISALAVRNQSVCGYTEDQKCDMAAGEKHLTEILCQNGYQNLTVKLFADPDTFADRLAQMSAMPEKMEEKEAAIREIIMDISL